MSTLRIALPWILSTAFLCAGCRTPSGFALRDTSLEQDNPIQDPDGWEFTVAPYAWLLAVDGDATVRGQRADIEQNFSDIWDKLDFVAEARLEGRKGRWGFTIDPTIGFLSDEADVGSTEVDVETTLFLLGVLGQYAVYDGPLTDAEDETRHLLVEASAGGILVDLDTELDFPAGTADPDQSESWVDPVVGLRGTFDLSDNYRMRLSGLVGGFGIGEASDLSVGVEGLLGRRLGESTTLWLGYRALSLEYDRGSGANELEADITIHGPTVGVAFTF